MAENSWPFYGAETNETQFSKWGRTLSGNGIASGMALTAPGGMLVRVGIGNALLRGLFYENTTTKDLAVGAAPAAGLTRLDAVVLKLDQDANTIQVIVRAGTANGTGGALPALTQNETVWELLIGTVSVAAGVASITTAMITELRPHPGMVVYPYASNAKRPNPSEDFALGVNTTTKRLELWIAAAWVNLSDFTNLAGTLAVAQGGTGVTTLKALREALDLFVRPTAPAHKKGRVWFPGPELD